MREIDQIKEKLDIVEFINGYVVLKPSGRNFKGLCPFHKEKTPSFFVSPDRQYWHCFGACNSGGDIISFYMKAEGLQFYEALQELSKRTGIKLSRNLQPSSDETKRSRFLEINHYASEYYHFILKNHKAGEAGRIYLESRGISDKIIDSFKLGFAPKGWRNITSYLLKKGFTKEELIECGISISSSDSLYDRFRSRVIFTLYDHRNNIVGFSGRLLDKDSKQAKYINSPETLLYKKRTTLFGLQMTKDEIRTKGNVIITEGEFDVLTSYSQGIGNVVAIKGTALTEDQLALLKRYTNELVLALDMDIAGDTASRRSIELAERFDFSIRVVSLTGGKDLDESIRNDIKSTKDAIEKAVPIYDFLIISAQHRFGTNDVYARKKIVSEVAPFIASISNSIVKDHYIRLLSKRLDISQEAILETVTKQQSKANSSFVKSVEKETKSEPQDRNVLLDEQLLALVVQSTTPIKLLKLLKESNSLSDIQTIAVEKVLYYMINQKDIPDELKDCYNRAHVTNLETILQKDPTGEKECRKTVNEIKKRALRRKLQKLATNIQKSDVQSKDETKEYEIVSQQLKKLEKQL